VKRTWLCSLCAREAAEKLSANTSLPAHLSSQREELRNDADSTLGLSNEEKAFCNGDNLYISLCLHSSTSQERKKLVVF